MDVLHEKLTKIKEIRYRMKKIMFNDRYGLTQAVIEGRKTMTRRLINLNSTSDVQVRIFAGYVQIIGRSGNVCAEKKLPYKVGEIVAVAQSYNEVVREFTSLALVPGSTNKMFVKAELMSHQINITGIKCERLYDISEADCLKEGVRVEFVRNDVPRYYYLDFKRQIKVWFDTPREAFASLIDKVSGYGTWQRNPWVVAYEFELVK